MGWKQPTGGSISGKGTPMNEKKIYRIAEFLADDIESEAGPKVGPVQKAVPVAVGVSAKASLKTAGGFATHMNVKDAFPNTPEGKTELEAFCKKWRYVGMMRPQGTGFTATVEVDYLEDLLSEMVNKYAMYDFVVSGVQ